MIVKYISEYLLPSIGLVEWSGVVVVAVGISAIIKYLYLLENLIVLDITGSL